MFAQKLEAFDETKPWERTTIVRYGTTQTFIGAGCTAEKFEGVLKEFKDKGINAMGIVTSKGAYKKCGAWDVITPMFEKVGMEIVHYDGIVTNPTCSSVDEATKLFRENKTPVGAILGIGGGSPLDAAKSVAVMMEYPEYNDADLFHAKFTPTKCLPLIVINLTHGTGTESDRFAVNTIDTELSTEGGSATKIPVEKWLKPCTAYDVGYPVYSFDDPLFTRSLGPELTAYVTIDCLNHVLEAATTLVASPLAVTFARHVVELIAEFLPIALKEPNNVRARYYLLYASLIGGISFDIALLHATHAMEHSLSALHPSLAHGMGLAMIMPAIYKRVYAAQPKVCKEIFEPIIALKGDGTEGDYLFTELRKWLAANHIPETVGTFFTEKDVPALVQNVRDCPGMGGLLGLAPFPTEDKDLAAIFTECL
eukprot:TRINITY_DN781882_c0_g1_i1.p1 TRINITY_DN781882_c0_g1~~TRINITY_DN781882_c0_g1_i1.p1  ORF type:complete len:447 (-),score=148.35 TRINITY_DN781882_c0_g1_i1:252-1523(-)